ncbi:DUF202 domain-containing protein [Micromonospora sp. NBC_01796]|uniref:DUF202 domain-containing protein n=1 Tax=Micromonospora sp. NBC_01796 TaxID=2975987 RepID=UPI002DD8CE7C|nr:DUF202 domain-containing protein [Micromonospora sp. NBC_01796]WSA87245.1 DUF202 domain-containing protein [Micromonospora sp. NBC_01796]
MNPDPGRPPERIDRDPGLQPERTRLARRRTGLAFAAVAALTVRLALADGMAVTLVVSAGLAAALLALGATITRRASRNPSRPAGGRTVPLLALVTVGYAGLGLLLVVGALG